MNPGLAIWMEFQTTDQARAYRARTKFPFRASPECERSVDILITMLDRPPLREVRQIPGVIHYDMFVVAFDQLHTFVNVQLETVAA
jgi:hypothetical protein